jgi:hypothetical protein
MNEEIKREDLQGVEAGLRRVAKSLEEVAEGLNSLAVSIDDNSK